MDCIKIHNKYKKNIKTVHNRVHNKNKKHVTIYK